MVSEILGRSRMSVFLRVSIEIWAYQGIYRSVEISLKGFA